MDFAREGLQHGLIDIIVLHPSRIIFGDFMVNRGAKRSGRGFIRMLGRRVCQKRSR